MNIRTYLAGGAAAATLMLGACHKADDAATNEVNAAAELRTWRTPTPMTR